MDILSALNVIVPSLLSIATIAIAARKDILLKRIDFEAKAREQILSSYVNVTFDLCASFSDFRSGNQAAAVKVAESTFKLAAISKDSYKRTSLIAFANIMLNMPSNLGTEELSIMFDEVLDIARESTQSAM